MDKQMREPEFGSFSEWNLSIILFNQQHFQFVRWVILYLFAFSLNFSWKSVKGWLNWTWVLTKNSTILRRKQIKSILNFRKLLLQPQQKVLPIKYTYMRDSNETWILSKCEAERSVKPTFFDWISIRSVSIAALHSKFGILKFIATSCFHLFRDVHNFVSNGHSKSVTNKKHSLRKTMNISAFRQSTENKTHFAQFSSNHKFEQIVFSCFVLHFLENRKHSILWKHLVCWSIESNSYSLDSIKTLMWLLL